MSKTVRIILSIAFVIFVAGIVWTIVATRNNKKDDTPKTANTPTLVGTPSSTTTPTATLPTPPAPTTVASKATTKKVVETYRTVIVEEPIKEIMASAWASAGTDSDGFAWAEARAN